MIWVDMGFRVVGSRRIRPFSYVEGRSIVVIPLITTHDPSNSSCAALAGGGANRLPRPSKAEWGEEIQSPAGVKAGERTMQVPERCLAKAYGLGTCNYRFYCSRFPVY